MVRSSDEVKYRAMAATLRELKWLKRLLSNLGMSQSEPVELFCDSQSTIHSAANPVFHERTKYTETDCHSVRYDVQDKIIATRHVLTIEQLADILTKALRSSTFDYLLSKLNVCDLHAPI